jgi:hypothetical protein
MSLEIRKKGNKNFTHIDSDFENEYGANDITIIFDGNTVKIRSFNGRIIFRRDGYDLSEITIYDDTASGSPENFGDVNLFKQRLINLGYPFAGFDSGETVVGIEDVLAGNNIQIDKADPNNPIISATLTAGTDGGTP